MNLNAFNQGMPRLSLPPKLLLIMRLIVVIMTVFILQANAVTGYGQKVTISKNNASIVELFKEINKQTGYDFLYTNPIIKDAKLISLKVRDADLALVLNLCFNNQPFTYSIQNKTIIIEPKAQAKGDIRGKVTESGTGAPLPGVTIRLAGGQNINLGKVTDTNGEYAFKDVPTGSYKMSVSYLGFEPQVKTMLIAEGKVLEANFQLSGQVSNLEQVVVTGYVQERKKDLTGAVSVVNLKEIKDIQTGNPMKALQGRIAGVSISTDGSPYGPATVRVRGIGTLGNNEPLYVIDGIPTKRGLHEINQYDIESIQVLKDASAASIYGSRAGNGVIIVSTKKAKKGYSKIELDASASVQKYNSKTGMLNSEQRGRAYWQAAINDGSDPNANQNYKFDWNNDFNNPVLNKVIIPEFIDEAKTMRAADTHWLDEISQTGITQSYNVTVSNGTEKGNNLLSIGYYDTKGTIRRSQDKKYTARLNTDYNFLGNKVKIGENLSVTYMDNQGFDVPNIINLSRIALPIVPVHTIDGGWGGPVKGMDDRHNPVRLIEDNKQNHNYFYRILGNVFVDVELLPKLNLRSNYAIDYDGSYGRALRKSYVSGFLADPSNLVNAYQSYDGSRVWQNTITYGFTKGKGQFDALLGHEYIKLLNQNFGASRQGLALETIDYAYLNAGSSNKDNYGAGSSNTLLSFFGKLNYIYDNKYIASVTLRRDGSSRFGSENRFAVFPSFSMGWRLSEEYFIKSNFPIISDLKLRYGWGKTGNQEIDNNAIYSLYSAIYSTDPTWSPDGGTAYDINGAGSGQLPSGFALTRRGNNNIKWETTTQSNIGLDFGLFDNKLSGSLDYYVKNTSDILVGSAYLGILGEGGTPTVNGASMQNKGLELTLGYQTQLNKDLSIDLSGNISGYRNKVTDLPPEVLTSYPGNGTDKNILGRPIYSRFGYVADGLFKTQAELDNSASQPGKGLGRIRYKDLNHDGVINGLDRDYIGRDHPLFEYGFNAAVNYKNFGLSFFVQGLQGNLINQDTKGLTDFASLSTGANWGSRTLEAWTPQNPNSTIPALTLVNSNDEGRPSSYFIESGSYLKLRNVQLNYSFDKLLVNKLKMQSARIYVQASNLLTIKSKSYSGPDPENPYNRYPVPIIGTLGLNVTF